MTTPRDGAPAAAADATVLRRLPGRGLASELTRGRSTVSDVRGWSAFMVAIPMAWLRVGRQGGREVVELSLIGTAQ